MILTEEQADAARRAASATIRQCRVPKRDHEDVYQDALLFALQAVERGHFEPSHIYNQCLGYLARRRRSQAADDVRAEEVARREAVDDDGPRAVDARLDLDEVLERAADFLTKRELRVMRLYADGLDTDEISESLDISKRAVANLRCNAIAKIRQRLDDMYTFDC